MPARIHTGPFALLRRLGPCVTKEELESLYQNNESVTRIFEKMLFFLIFKKKWDKPTAAGAYDSGGETPIMMGPFLDVS